MMAVSRTKGVSSPFFESDSSNEAEPLECTANEAETFWTTEPPSPATVADVKITASSWAVGLESTGAVLGGKLATKRREIASITKIMTCLITLEYMQRHELSFELHTTVSQLASRVGGTSARLHKGEVVSIWDLLHGLMLPSGNDAAMCLAEFIGKKLLRPSVKPVLKKQCIKAFVAEMNRRAKEFGLTDTSYANPHGMSFPKNKSTAQDVCLLASIAMQNETFRQIVNTEEYVGRLLTKKTDAVREVLWQNTNKLLSQGFYGVKTGVTPNAGPCLCACSEGLIIVVLSCKTKDSRWAEVPQLLRWWKAGVLDGP